MHAPGSKLGRHLGVLLRERVYASGSPAALGCRPGPFPRRVGLEVFVVAVVRVREADEIGALAGIREAQPAVEEMREAYDARRRVIVDGLRAAGLPTFEPEGAFYAFPDITSTGLSSEDFAQRLLQEEHVACVPGSAFGPSGEGYLRCSYATAIDQIEEAVKRIHRFADKVRGEGA